MATKTEEEKEATTTTTTTATTTATTVTTAETTVTETVVAVVKEEKEKEKEKNEIITLLNIPTENVWRYHLEGINDYGWGCVYRNAQTLIEALHNINNNNNNNTNTNTNTNTNKKEEEEKEKEKEEKIKNKKPPKIIELVKYYFGNNYAERVEKDDWKDNKKSLWIEPHDVEYYLKDSIHGNKYQHLNTELLLFKLPLNDNDDFFSSFSRNYTKEPTMKVKYNGYSKDYKDIRDKIQEHLKNQDLPILIDDGTYSYLISGIDRENSRYQIMDPHYGMLYAKKDQNNNNNNNNNNKGINNEREGKEKKEKQKEEKEEKKEEEENEKNEKNSEDLINSPYGSDIGKVRWEAFGWFEKPGKLWMMLFVKVNHTCENTISTDTSSLSSPPSTDAT